MVQVLGTFCVEWEEGAQQCAEFLDGADRQNALIEKLVAIAGYFGFDGWLLNFEIKLHRTEVPRLKSFVDELTMQMHASDPSSLVIW